MYEEEIHFRKVLLKQFEMVLDLEHLTLVTLDMWTMFEEGRSRCSWVYDRKRKSYRQTDRPNDMCKAKCPLFFEGRHNNWAD